MKKYAQGDAAKFHTDTARLKRNDCHLVLFEAKKQRRQVASIWHGAFRWTTAQRFYVHLQSGLRTQKSCRAAHLMGYRDIEYAVPI